MKMMIVFYTMAVTSLIVMIAGTALILWLLFYAAESIWAKHSALAHNVKDYLLHKNDFSLYQRDVHEWDKAKNRHQTECRNCQYRKEFVKREQEADTDE